MKRMIKELNLFYSPAMKREMAKKVLILYPIFIAMILFMKYSRSYMYSVGFSVFLLVMIPVGLLVLLPLQWLLDIKPITDKWRKEHELQKKWSYFYQRFMHKE